MILSAQKAKASPRGRASYRRAKAPPALLLWEPRPRGESDGSVSSKSKSFAPRSGLLQKSQSAAALLLWEARPAANAGCAATQKQSFAPRSGLLQEEPKRQPHRFSWEARPAANAEVLSAQKPKASPRGRGSYRSARSVTRTAFFVGGATRGECGGSTSSKQKLRPEVGPPTRRAKASAAPLFVGGAPRGECGGSASSKAKASPRGRASYRRAKSATRTAFLWEARPAANQASEPLSRAVPRSVRRARRSRRRRAETGYARLVPRQPSEPRPRLPPAAFQGAIQ